MKRRTYLTRAGAVLFAAVLAGCGGQSGSDADSQASDGAGTPEPTATATATPTPTPAATATATPTETPTPTPTPEPVLDIDKTAVVGGDYPRELEAGMVMRYEIEIHEGTSAFLTVSHEDNGQVFSESTRTKMSGRWEVNSDGLHYIQLSLTGETKVKIVVR